MNSGTPENAVAARDELVCRTKGIEDRGGDRDDRKSPKIRGCLGFQLVTQICKQRGETRCPGEDELQDQSVHDELAQEIQPQAFPLLWRAPSSRGQGPGSIDS